MSPKSQRNRNTIVGGALLGAGGIAWLTALVFAVSPSATGEVVLPAQKDGLPELALCTKGLQGLGYKAESKPDETITVFEELTDPEAQLDRATTAVLLCGYTLESFCIGEGCEKPGLSFKLSRK